METGDFHSLEKLQITEDYFTSPEVREIYRYLRDTFHGAETSGHVPSVQMAQTRFPSFFPQGSYDSVPILCSELRRERLRMEFLSLSQRLAIEAEKDPQAALTTLKSETSKLSALSEVGSDMTMAGAYQVLLDRYEMVQNQQGLLGIPFPWAQLNEETQGMQGGQFIIIYGRPKSMKTWIANYIAVNAYLNHNCRVLFYTREMSPFMVAQRTAANIAGVAYKAFKNGTLQPELKQRTFEILKELSESEQSVEAHTAGANKPMFSIVSDRTAGGGGGGVGWLRAKIKDLKPHLVVVDGMYLMKDDRSNTRTIDWKNIAHISQDLKLTAQEFDIPVIGVTQANRGADKAKGDDLTELSYSDSIGQDADAVLRVTKTERFDDTINAKRTELYITAPGIREGKFEGIVINGEPAVDFKFVRMLIDSDSAASNDHDYSGDKKKYAANRPPGATWRRDPKIGI